MHATILYAIAYAAAIGLIILWKAWHLIVLRARERLISVLSRWLFYTVILPRVRGSTDATIFSVILVILFGVGNIVGSTLAVHTKAELSMRLARLSILNMIVLFVGGRTNIAIDKVLKWSMTEYSFLHRWVGRVSVVEALIHGLLEYLDRRSINPYEISVCCLHPRTEKVTYAVAASCSYSCRWMCFSCLHSTAYLRDISFNPPPSFICYPRFIVAPHGTYQVVQFGLSYLRYFPLLHPEDPVVWLLLVPESRLWSPM